MIKLTLHQSPKVPPQIPYFECQTKGKTSYIRITILRARAKKGYQFHVIVERYKANKLQWKKQAFRKTVNGCRKYANKKIKNRGYKIRKAVNNDVR